MFSRHLQPESVVLSKVKLDSPKASPKSDLSPRGRTSPSNQHRQSADRVELSARSAFSSSETYNSIELPFTDLDSLQTSFSLQLADEAALVSCEWGVLGIYVLFQI